MSFEPHAGPQAGQAIDSQSKILAIGERSLMDVWRVLTKRRYAILSVTALCTALAVWHAYRTPPVYETSSTIEIKPSSLNNNSMELEEDEDVVALQTEVAVIQSDSVLFQTAQSINLIRMVRQREGKDTAGESVSSAPIDPRERRAMLGIVKDGLSIVIVPNTRILAIRYQGTDPILAAEIVNGLVDTYSDEGLRISFERTAHVSDWLDRQINDLKQDAADAQRQLADYQKAHNIVGTDQNSNLTLQTLEKISGELDDAEADRIMKEARMRDFNTMKPDMMALTSDDPTVATLYSQLTDFENQRAQMATKLGPKHPAMQQIDFQIKKVQAQIDNEVELAKRQVQDEYQAAVQLEDALRGRLGAQEDAAYKLNEDVAQYSMLRHQAELTRNLYDTLQTNLKEATINAGMAAANITVIDRAEVPIAPISAKKSKTSMLGLLAGLVIGCVLAFVIESIDDRLRTSEEVENASMLPSLAAIPHLASGPGPKKGEDRGQAAPGSRQALQKLITLWDPKSNGAEAYRSMRSALLLSSIDSPPRIIVVTSSFPSEGKTTTALNLAVVLAQRGEHVLLVDADLRRGSLNHVFGLPSQGFGLSTVLLSHPGEHPDLPTPLAELPTLHVLPTGPRPPNPAEMLSSNRMEEQMRLWAQEFDRVVIDTAPLLAVSDTQTLAVRSDAVVLVARAGVTRKRALMRARDLLWRVNAPVAGVVVNDVDLRLENFYTYRYGMYSKDYWYGDGYRQGAKSSSRAYGYEDEEKSK
ncbi:MAG: polysaccharide biosynthesis tyrosine autokinase [Terracidiphilus sp.]|jgi:capsular exopolysaccharide synthesis family protein